MTRQPTQTYYGYTDSDEAGVYWIQTDRDSIRDRVEPGVTKTHLLGDVFNKLNSYVVPLGVAVCLFSPGMDNVRRRFRVAGATTIPETRFDHRWYEEDSWRIVLEPVLEEELNELKRLWELPYAGPPAFNYAEDSE